MAQQAATPVAAATTVAAAAGAFSVGSLFRQRSFAGNSLLAAAGALAGGTALLVTFIALGRPPVSPPTLAGLRVFVPLAIVLLVAWEMEAQLVARRRRCSIARARGWVLAGYTPLATAWPLVWLLYLPEVHHWFATVPSVKPAMALTLLAPALALKLGLVAVAGGRQLGEWCWRYRYWLAGGTYAAAALAAKPSLWHTDLAGWFVPAAKLILAGQPLEVYSIRVEVMGTPTPIEHGPLTVLFYAPFIALAELAGKTDFLRVGALFPLAGILLVDGLMAYQAAQAVRDLAPDSSERHRYGVFVLILFSPLLWFSSVWLAHLESLLALLIIAAVRLLARGHAGRAGLLIGAALLVKHSAALSAGPLLVLLALTGRLRLAVVAGAVAATVFAAALAPFAIASPNDFFYNFRGYDPLKPIYGLTIWKAIYDSGLEPLVMRWSSTFIGALALAGTAALGLAVRRTLRGMAAYAAGLARIEYCWTAIVLGQLAWLGLATWQYPHYLVLGFIALLIWESAITARRRDGSWPVLALLFLFVPFNLQAHFPQNVGKAGGAFVVARAAAQLAFFYGCAVAVWVRALRPPAPATPASPVAAATPETGR